MTTPAAKILIDADDLASKKFEEAARNAEKNIKAVKETGQKAKASTEFFGTLANTLGGSQLGSYASQLGQLTEKVSQFSEVSKSGAAGALAFRAGLVGLAATLSFKVGRAIGDAAFETKKWREELAKAIDEARRLDIQFAKSMQTDFSLQKEEISLIGDPDKQRKEMAALLRDIEKQIAGTQDQIRRKEAAAIPTTEEAWMSFPSELEMKKVLNDTTAEKSRLEVLREQRDELQQQLSARRLMIEQERVAASNRARSSEFLEGLREEIRLLKTKKENMAEFEASRNTFGREDMSLGVQLLKERDALKAKLEADKQAAAEAERVAAKTIADAERIADFKANEIARLKEQRIALEQGAEAAKAFALEQQGLDKATAQRLAAEQASLERLKEEKDKQAKLEEDQKKIDKSAQLQAQGGRLLTRGPTSDPINKVATNTEKANKELERANKLLESLNAKPTAKVAFKVVSA